MAQRYGLEIECFGLTENELREAILSVEGLEYGGHFNYHGSRRLGLRCKENNNGHLWVSENDGSLCGLQGPEDEGHEVISPVMEGEAGLRIVGQVMTALTRAGAQVNRQCGLHTTFGIENSHARFRRMSAKKKAQVISKIVDAYDWFEAGFDALVSSSRRYWSSNAVIYASHIEYPYGFSNGYGQMNGEDSQTLVRRGVNRGYINIESFLSKGIIEFRQHNGTLNRWKIYNWTLLLQRLVQWAVNNRHENFGADLRDFAPTLEGLMDLTACGSDLRSALEARANELDLVHIDENGVHTYRMNGPRYAERMDLFSNRAITAALEADQAIIGGSN